MVHYILGLALALAPLSDRIDRVADKVQTRQLQSAEHTPWVIMHAAIAFKTDATVFDDETGKDVEAIKLLLTRGLFEAGDGTPTLPRVPEIEHHVNQYLMMLALADVSPDRVFIDDTGGRHRVAELIRGAKREFEDDQEVGWTLVALTTYVPPDERWTGDNGRTYGIGDVVARGIERDPRDEAEGGTHHLFGVAFAFRAHVERGGAIEGVWKEAKAYLDRHVETVRRFQLDDGAFSDGLLKERKAPESPSALVFSTGHTLEWLTFALTEEALAEPWVERAVIRLCQEIEQHPVEDFSDGGVYHAVNALRLYQSKLLSPDD